MSRLRMVVLAMLTAGMAGTLAVAGVTATPKPAEALECAVPYVCTTMSGWVCNCGEDCWKLEKCNLVSGGDPFRQECELIPD